jgi:hypothetical protein
MATSKYAALYSSSFLAVWTAYPWKSKKGDAWKAFQQVSADQHIDAILEALSWQIAQPRWTKDHGQYIPLLGTYLRARGWEDEPFEARPGPVYHGWDCPHEPACEQRHWCELKSAKTRMA